MIQTPAELIQKWVQAVNEGNVEALIGMYNEKAVLIPTFSNRMRKTPERIRDYFETLEVKAGLHLGLHENTVTIIP
ncbi:MAG: hypothetical protein PF483_11020, partial [Halothiobacillus sp.]|nr:hypothetical protein [Halothiobacillus sp.]